MVGEDGESGRAVKRRRRRREKEKKERKEAGLYSKCKSPYQRVLLRGREILIASRILWCNWKYLVDRLGAVTESCYLHVAEGVPCNMHRANDESRSKLSIRIKTLYSIKSHPPS